MQKGEKENSMNEISILFSVLSDVESEMEQTELSNNIKALNSLDVHYNQIWKDILGYQPVSDEARELMFLMLLDRLAEKAARGESTSKVREKILAMFHEQEAAGKCPNHG